MNVTSHKPGDWQLLAEEERYRFVSEACERFKMKYGDFPRINYIGNTPDWIFVQTSLPHGTAMPELPSSFEEIPVEQEGHREAMDRFIATWTAILQHIGGWTSEQIGAWANDRHYCFSSGWFLHDSPVPFVIPLLLPETLRIVPGISLDNKIGEAIVTGIATDRNLWHPDLDPNYDWNAARRRVRAIVDEAEANQQQDQ